MSWGNRFSRLILITEHKLCVASYLWDCVCPNVCSQVSRWSQRSGSGRSHSQAGIFLTASPTMLSKNSGNTFTIYWCACGCGWTLNWATSKIRLLICAWSHQHTYVIQTKNTQAETTLNQCHEIQFGMRTLHCVASEKKKIEKGALKWFSLCAQRVMLQPGGLKSSSKVSTCEFLAPFELIPLFS